MCGTEIVRIHTLHVYSVQNGKNQNQTKCTEKQTWQQWLTYDFGLEHGAQLDTFTSKHTNTSAKRAQTHTTAKYIICCAKKRRKNNTVGRSVVCIFYIYITANPNKYNGRGPVNAESMRRQTGKRRQHTNGKTAARLSTNNIDESKTFAEVWVRESSMEQNCIVNIVCSATCNTFAVAVCLCFGIK